MHQYPEYAADLFDDEAILTPYHHYTSIRDAGPVVHLSATNALAVGRFDDVRAALMDNQRFISSKGVGLNTVLNGMGIEGTLTSDPPRHAEFRRTLIQPMTAKALTTISEQVQAEADGLIDRLVETGSFDGVKDLAMHLPVEIVAKLVGLPADLRANMLDWAAAAFDTLGPIEHPRVQASMEIGLGLVDFMANVERDRMHPGGWADQLYQAADRGDITPDMVPGMLVDYVVPSLDTTVAATSHMLYQFGSNPEQWDLFLSDPSLARNAIDETLRIESPIRGFARLTAEDVEIGGVMVDKDTRIFLLYASANRDERHWVDPDRFDIERADLKKQMAFGFGIHLCAGQYLARLEMTCLLNAMAKRVKRIEVKNPHFKLNSSLRIHESLDVTFN